MAFTSTHRFARISPQKARLVIDLIRGREYNDAMSQLEFSKKRAAVMIRKVLAAAAASADAAEADVRNLVITDARVDGGPHMKRFQPKDRGRAHQILKRSCHIRVTVDEKNKPSNPSNPRNKS